MFILLLVPLVFLIANAEALDKFKTDQDAGAKWHYVGETQVDPTAKSIAHDGKVYYKLKKKKKESLN